MIVLYILYYFPTNNTRNVYVLLTREACQLVLQVSPGSSTLANSSTNFPLSKTCSGGGPK